MLQYLSDALTIGTTIGIVLAAVARVVPNAKVFTFGQKCGLLLSGFGRSRMGSVAWSRLEGFLVNSVGEYFRGLKVGLDQETDQTKAAPIDKPLYKDKKTGKPNVRI